MDQQVPAVGLQLQGPPKVIESTVLGEAAKMKLQPCREPSWWNCFEVEPEMTHSPTAVVSVTPSCLRNTDWEELVSGVASKLQNGSKLLNVHLQMLLV